MGRESRRKEGVEFKDVTYATTLLSKKHKDDGLPDFRTLYHFYQELVLIGHSLSLDESVIIGMIEQIIQCGDLGNVEGA